MLSARENRRSFRSLKSLIQFTNDSHQNELELHPVVPKQPRVIHLPPSIHQGENISPTLWAWIQSKDFTMQNDLFSTDQVIKTSRNGIPVQFSNLSLANHSSYGPDNLPRLIAYSGQVLKFPTHLTEDQGMLQRSRTLGRVESKQLLNSRASLNHSIRLKALPRKPLPNQQHNEVNPVNQTMEKPKVARLYLQLLSAHIKSTVQSIYFQVQLGNGQKFYTLPEQCIKTKQGQHVELKEAFIFDIPQQEEFTVCIALFSQSRQQDVIPNSPSMESIETNASTNASSVTSAQISTNNFSSLFGMRKTPTTASSDASSLIGELTITLPSTHFPKVTGTYNLGIGTKKEIAKCTLQMGLILDEKDFFNTPPVIQPPLTGFMNIQLCTATTRVWRRYWASYSDKTLNIYDFEYQEAKKICQIDKCSIQKVEKNDLANDITCLNVLKFVMRNEFLISDCNFLDEGNIYMMFDDTQSYEEWYQHLI